MNLVTADLELADSSSFGRLGAALDSLTTEADLQRETEYSPTDAARIVTCRSYLFLLGYLKKDSKSEKLESQLVDAAARFQSECGIEDDGVLNNATWTALADLCQYQSPCPIELYLVGEKPTLALKRAIQLRLFSLGLTTKIYDHSWHQKKDKKKAKDEKALVAGIEEFREIQALLGVNRSEMHDNYSIKTLDFLMNHDRLIQQLTHFSMTSSQLKVKAKELELRTKKPAQLITSYQKNLSLVELWLLGYKVRPGNFSPEDKDNRVGDETLSGALKKFVRDRDLEATFSRTQLVLTGRWFFQEVIKVHEESVAAEGEDLTEEVLEKMETDRQFQQSVADSYRSVGARIFDGIKRIFGWFKKTVKKVTDLIKRGVKNLVRLLRRGALKVYERLKAIVTAVQLGIEFYAKPVFPGSDPNSIYVRHDKDLDFDVFVNTACTPEKLDVFFDRLNIRAELFQLACLIVGKLLSLARQVFKMARPVTGWFGLLMTLIRLGRWLKSIYKLSGIAAERLAQLSDMRVVEASFSA